jgi:hypothetical protein
MKPLLIVLLLAACSRAATYNIDGLAPAPWTKLLEVVGLSPTSTHDANVEIVSATTKDDLLALAQDRIVIVEGIGTATDRLGITPKQASVSVRQICDTHAPQMQIIWEQPVTIPDVTLDARWKISAKEKWRGTPVLAVRKTEHGAIVWLATAAGDQGFERYPYLIQTLGDAGLDFPVRATNLWAFFDSSYRIRADVDYLARGWRQSGISVLHVAAWHNMERDPARDEYLKNLIEACHRNAILVYAWLELPHVSEQFWADHPEWREKTAAGQDAQLDWRKLMNLQNAACHRAIETQIGALFTRFDWDGVNVAELYFESLEGASNPARFTPMNEDVRAEFTRSAGFDPKLLFDPSSPYSKDSAAVRQFLDFRAQLASRMQADWLDVIDRQKKSKPYLDVVLTHIDDRFEPGIRDALGADVARSLPMIQARRSTLLIEDPATLWSLGPERYSKLAAKYRDLAPGDHFAVDINVVERYQDVYPTKKQTGAELLELVHQAAASFGRVALYFENSLEKQDLALLPVAASTARLASTEPDRLTTTADSTTRVRWTGPVELDGSVWPVQSATDVLVPAGKHALSAGVTKPPVLVSDFNGEIRSAAVIKTGVEMSYSSRSRSLALLAQPVAHIEVDGVPFGAKEKGPVLLPSGEHVVTFTR